MKKTTLLIAFATILLNYFNGFSQNLLPCGSIFTDPAGSITNYADNSDYIVTIFPDILGEKVTVTFTAFNTETNYDALYVFDGNSTASPLISSSNPAGTVPGSLPGGFWGTTIPGPFTSTSADGSLTFRFRSDSTINMAGWQASVNCSPASLCLTPSNLSTVVYATSTQLNWTENGSALSWEIYIVAAGAAAPTALNTGTIVNTNSFTLTAIIPNTYYNIYIRSICANNNVSSWSNAHSFINSATCIAPNQIVSSNITTTSANYSWANNNNNTASYEYAVQLSSINTIPTSGTIINTNTVALSGLTAGTTYKLYVRALCNNQFTSNWTTSTFTTVVNCVSPTNLVSSSITSNTANYSWTNNNNTANYEYAVQLSSINTIPTSGTIINTNTVALSGLTAGTTYKLYVRGLCSNQYFSAWSNITFITAATPPLAPICGNLFIDNGNSTANYNNNTNEITIICPANAGDVVTVTFSSFDIEESWDGLYVFNGNSVLSPPILSSNPIGTSSGACTAPGAFWGTIIPEPFTSSSSDGCLTFRFVSDSTLSKAGWVASVACSPPPTCIKPDVQINIQTSSTALISWNNSNATQWEVLILPAGTVLNATLTGVLVNANSYQPNNLISGSSYDVYVRAICTATDISNWSNVKKINLISCTKPVLIPLTNYTANSVVANWINSGINTEFQILIMPSGSFIPNLATVATYTTSTLNYILTGLIQNNMYDLYVRSVCDYNELSVWSDVLTFTMPTLAAPLTPNVTTYSPTQLVTNILANNPCITISNVTSSSGNNFGMVNGLGSFFNTNPNFPISSGIMLSSGNALSAVGPNTTILSEGTNNWPGDSDLNNIIAAATSTAMSSLNATKLEFDFTTINEFMSFNFVFASEEYGAFQCQFADAFAFLLTDTVSGITTNLAVVPGTTTPVSVVTIRDGLNNTSCTTANAGFFGGMNNNYNSATNYNGQTALMTASSALIPNHLYHIKLVIADRLDSMFDSTVFIEAGGFAAGPPQCNDQIQLISFLDSNGDGIKNNNESNFNFGSFIVQKNNNGVQNFITTPTANYVVYDNNSLNTYDFNYIINNEYLPYYSLTNTSYNDLHILLGSGNQVLYFPVTLIQNYNDVSVNIVPISPPIPGSDFKNKVIYKNSGITTTSGTVNFVKDIKTIISNCSQTGVINNINGFSYNFNNLQPFETRSFVVTMSVPTLPTVSIGELLTTSATISAANVDFDTANNIFSNSQIVVSSYDPNDKNEIHGGKIQITDFTTNDDLIYTIRFQNTGTSNAVNIRLEDLIDSQFDLNSIRMIGSSHDYILERINNKLTWKFNFINLVSIFQNFDLSQGFVTFKAKLKPGFNVGTIIPNVAKIYFDTNPAIETNIFNTEFVSVLANKIFTDSNFKIFPNPASKFVQINLQLTSDNIQNISVNDVLGKLIKRFNNLSSKQITIDVSELEKGIYLLEITTENNLKQIKKLIIE